MPYFSAFVDAFTIPRRSSLALTHLFSTYRHRSATRSFCWRSRVSRMTNTVRALVLSRRCVLGRRWTLLLHSCAGHGNITWRINIAHIYRSTIERAGDVHVRVPYCGERA